MGSADLRQGGGGRTVSARREGGLGFGGGRRHSALAVGFEIFTRWRAQRAARGGEGSPSLLCHVLWSLSNFGKAKDQGGLGKIGLSASEYLEGAERLVLAGPDASRSFCGGFWAFFRSPRSDCDFGDY